MEIITSTTGKGRMRVASVSSHGLKGQELCGVGAAEVGVEHTVERAVEREAGGKAH